MATPMSRSKSCAPALLLAALSLAAAPAAPAATTPVADAPHQTATVAPPAPDDRIHAAAEALAPKLVDLRRDLHMHPELGNRETRTGALVAERLRALGIEVRYPVARTGVLAVLRGGRPGRTSALRADIDALPIQETNDVPYKSRVPGVKHACGHDAHTSIVLGVAEVLAGLRAELPGTVVFLFQPAEEGPPEGEEGGALLMMKEGALIDPPVDAVFGLHADPLLDAGTVGWAVGPIFASSDTFRITVAGKSTHGALPHTGLDPIPVAADLIEALQPLVSRETDARSPKVLTIGTIHGGNRFNIIADKVTMDGTLRTLDEAVRADLKTRMERTVAGIAAAHGTTATLAWIGASNPALMNDAALTRASLPALRRACGPDRVVEVPPQMAAEDFAHLARRVPGFYLKLGVRNEKRGITAMLHTAEFDLDEAVLPLGVRALANVVWDFNAAPAPEAR
jgi:amidohydrolase